MQPDPRNSVLYLFNSGFSGKYLRNTLDTLCHPMGATNPYSYSTVAVPGGSAVNVDAANLSQVLGLPVNFPVVIVFIDRYGPSSNPAYVYHPLRRGFLASPPRQDNGRLNVRVKLDQLCVATNAGSFSASVAAALVPAPRGAPHFAGSPENRADGNYAVVGPDLTLQNGMPVVSDDWTSLVGRLSATKALGSTPTKAVIFARTRFTPDDNPAVDVVPAFREHEQEKYLVERGQSYRLRVTYSFPFNAIAPLAPAQGAVEFGGNLDSTSSKNVAIDAIAREVDFVFATADHVERRTSYATIFFVQPPGATEFISPRIDIPLRITGRRWDVVVTVIAVLIFVAGATITGLDLSKGVTPALVVVKLIAGILQAGAVLALFSVRGNKPL